MGEVFFLCEHCRENSRDVFFCNSCLRLRIHLPEHNLFQIFRVTPGISFSEDLLDDRYEEIMSSIHPDLFLNASLIEQEKSLQYSTILQETKELLSEPFRSALYILQMLQIEYEKKDIEPNSIFLSDMFDWQEDLESSNYKLAENHPAIKLYYEVYSKLESLFNKLLNETQDRDKLVSEILDNLGQYKFLRNFYFQASGQKEKAHF